VTTVLHSHGAVTERDLGGARAAIVRRPGHPLTAVSLRFRGGSAAEPLGRSGLAHLLEHLMFAGTPSRPAGAFHAMVQDVGGFTNGITSADATEFVHMVHPNTLGDVFEAERDRFAVTSAGWTEADLAREAQIVLRERSHRVDRRPLGSSVESLLLAAFGPDHPYGRPPVGAASGVLSVSLLDVEAFFRSHYTASALSVVVVGDVDVEWVMDQVAAIVDTLPSAEAPVARHLGAGGGTPARLTKDSAVRRLFLGYWVPSACDRAYADAQLIGLALAGSSGLLSSALLSRGLAADVAIRTIALEQSPSLLIIEVTPSDDVDMDTLSAEVRGTLDSVVRRRVSTLSAELDRARRTYTTRWAAQHDSVIRRVSALGETLQRHGTTAAYLDPLQRVRNVPTPELAAGLAEWFSAPAAAEVTYEHGAHGRVA